MPNHSAVQIANEFLRRRASSTWPRQMQLQKLVYIANGWNLAINREPLVTELPQAWDNGPVYQSLWRHIKDFGYRGPHCELTNPFEEHTPLLPALEDSEKAVLDHVWARYGNYSAKQLSDMTHEPGTPWTNAYLGRGRNAELDLREIQDHYVNLAIAGREQRAT